MMYGINSSPLARRMRRPSLVGVAGAFAAAPGMLHPAPVPVASQPPESALARPQTGYGPAAGLAQPPLGGGTPQQPGYVSHNNNPTEPNPGPGPARTSLPLMSWPPHGAAGRPQMPRLLYKRKSPRLGGPAY